ncbi:hypothetical protein ISCGN_032094 [Ixodes scapularis]
MGRRCGDSSRQSCDIFSESGAGCAVHTRRPHPRPPCKPDVPYCTAYAGGAYAPRCSGASRNPADGATSCFCCYASGLSSRQSTSYTDASAAASTTEFQKCASDDTGALY